MSRPSTPRDAASRSSSVSSRSDCPRLGITSARENQKVRTLHSRLEPIFFFQPRVVVRQRTARTPSSHQNITGIREGVRGRVVEREVAEQISVIDLKLLMVSLKSRLTKEPLEKETRMAARALPLHRIMEFRKAMDAARLPKKLKGDVRWRHQSIRIHYS